MDEEHFTVGDPIRVDTGIESPEGTFEIRHPLTLGRERTVVVVERFAISACDPIDADDAPAEMVERSRGRTFVRCALVWDEVFPSRTYTSRRSVVFSLDRSAVEDPPAGITWSTMFWNEYRQFRIYVKRDRFVAMGTVSYEPRVWIHEAPVVRTPAR